ncbi:hypothetical protein EW146_g3907 [Bondarzewia mesenterica]|uniref:UvrD-like helicase ATP-binding domain-containing protein n=1 Tax=Bondarzewia mesenterica TaxID=1095465 RepID=A0A4S4LYA1_9AGAM|nr:hypothetical protein EW146_g3907 [Bondarzewia mesenterica]
MDPRADFASNKYTDILIGLNIFKPELLLNDEDLDAALDVLEGTLDSESVATILTHAMQKTFAFEFVISVVKEDVFSFLSNWILDKFPATLDDYDPNLLTMRLLGQLHLSLFSVEFPSDHQPESLDPCMRAVALAPPVLAALPDIVEHTEIYTNDSEAASRTNPRPRARKMSKVMARSSMMINMKPFRDMDVEAPTNPTAAKELAAQILADQKGILEHFLGIVRWPALRPIFKQAYLSQRRPSPEPQVQPEVSLSVTDDSPVTTPFTYASQSLRASLYHESAEGFGQWRIYLSGRAEEDLRAQRRGDAKSFEIVWNKLRELSNGRFTETTHKKLTGPQTPIPIFQARLPGDLRIVYQVDCTQEYETDHGHQGIFFPLVDGANVDDIFYPVLTIFGLYNHSAISREFWDNVGRIKARRFGKEYSDRCRLREHPRHTGEDVFSPISFPASQEKEIEETQLEIPDLVANDLEDLHSLLALEKYVAASQNVLNSLLADDDVAHIFRVSPQEQQVIEHTHSCYVLGRSGTGKTTTMLFKMFGIERAWVHSGCIGARPRQVFVTKSRVLAEKVEEYFTKVLRSFAHGSHVPPHLITMLERGKTRGDRGLVDAEEDVNWRNDLPLKFSELTDSHYPLFITFDKIEALVNADMDLKVKSSGQRRLSLHQKQRFVSTVASGRSMVTFETFEDEYWPHFPQNLRKGLAPSLVFDEFIGVIKGSQESLKYRKRRLDRTAYNNLSFRTRPVFADRRDVLYSLFESYSKRKIERDDRDAADRTHEVLNGIQENGLVGKKFDFLYVDEVQDLLMVDTLLLRCLCKNPDGLFWAGDTAQTISFGSAFRFNDLTSFLYEIERKSLNHTRSRALKKPEFFQLLTNYRSHAGIVNCAHSVIELVKEFWINSIDILDRERGIIDGMRPLFFNGWNESRFNDFFSSAGGPIELGQDQCIIVRDDSAREKLYKKIGQYTRARGWNLMMHVLIYNVFADSPVDVKQWWRIIDAAPGGRSDQSSRAQVGNENAGVCNELKFLYVAITRARKNLWFVDESEVCMPMKKYWIDQNLVEVRSPGEGIAQFAVASKPEEWAGRARGLFDQHQFYQAMLGFKRANMPREAAVAAAYRRRRQARQEGKKPAYLDAADAFFACGSDTSTENEINTYFRIAGECYVEARKYDRAAKAYRRASMYTEAAFYFMKARMLDEAVSILKMNEVAIDVAEKITNTARCTYLNDGKLEQAAELFQDEEEQEDFMRDLDFGLAHAQFLEKNGKYVDAAEHYIQEGRIMYAIEILLKDSSNPEALRKAKSHILSRLWIHLSFGVHPNSLSVESDLEVQDLFEHLAKLSPDALDPDDRREAEMFRAIYSYDMEVLKRLGHWYSQPGQNKPAALLCLDHLFDDLDQLETSTQLQAVFSLSLFYAYACLMSEVIMHEKPWASDSIRKLFALERDPVSEDQLTIHSGTFVAYVLSKDGVQPSRINSDPDALQIPNWQLPRTLRKSLTTRLQAKTLDENQRVSVVDVFNPCVDGDTFGHCRKPHCHLVHQIDVQWFNRRVRFHLQQISIVNIIQSLPFSDFAFVTRMQQRRLWLDRLDNVLNPLFPRHGSSSVFRIDMIPEAPSALQVVKLWIPDVLYNLNPSRPELQRPFLTNFLKAITTGYRLEEKVIGICLSQVPCVHSPRQWHPRLRGQDRSVYALKSLVGFMRGTDDIFSLSRGASFFAYIVGRRFPIHIGVICQLLDRLCGLFVLAHNFRGTSLHGVTLPRAWLIDLWKDLDAFKNQPHGSYKMIVDAIPALLDRVNLLSLTADSRFKPRELNRDIAVSMSIARICRAICLLGYNIEDGGAVQWEVFQTVTSLTSAGSNFPMIYEPFVLAKDWDDLMEAVWASAADDSPLDEMIELYSDRNPEDWVTPRGVRRVIFHDIDDIPSLLDPHTPYRLPRIAKANTARHIKQVDGPNIAEDISGHISTHGEIDGDSNTVHHAIESSGRNEADLDELDADDDEEVYSAAASHRREMAAVKIQRAYRHVLRLRQTNHNEEVKRGDIAASHARLFAACMKQVSRLDRGKPVYRCLFRGVLPLLLVCLERMLAIAGGVKAHAKKRHRNECAVSYSTGTTEKKLSPKSTFHQRYSKKELWECAAKTMELMGKLPKVQTDPLKRDMEIVMEVLSIRKTGHLKPRLNVDDL